MKSWGKNSHRTQSESSFNFSWKSHSEHELSWYLTSTYFYSFLFSVINPFYVFPLLRMTNSLPSHVHVAFSHWSLTLSRNKLLLWRKMTNAFAWHRNMIKLHNTPHWKFLSHVCTFSHFAFLFSFSLALWKWQIYHIYLGGARESEQKQISAKWLGNCANKYHQSVNNHHTHAIGGFLKLKILLTHNWVEGKTVVKNHSPRRWLPLSKLISFSGKALRENYFNW